MSLEGEQGDCASRYDGFSNRVLSMIDEVFSETYTSHFPGQEPTIGREP